MAPTRTTTAHLRFRGMAPCSLFRALIRLRVGIFDVKTGKRLGPELNLGTNEDILGLAFSPDGKYLTCSAPRDEDPYSRSSKP